MTAAAETGTATVASVVIVIEAAEIAQAGDIPKDTVMVAGIIAGGDSLGIAWTGILTGTDGTTGLAAATGGMIAEAEPMITGAADLTAGTADLTAGTADLTVGIVDLTVGTNAPTVETDALTVGMEGRALGMIGLLTGDSLATKGISRDLTI